MDIKLLKEKFTSLYHTDKKGIKVYFAPGRVNLIGEHTDYNGGYVMPCALNFGTTLLISENGRETFRFATTNFDTKGEISIKPPFEKTGNEWYFYPLGVADQFAKAGRKLKGFDFLFSGDIPNGAGLSSSASIEMVTAFALNDLLRFGHDMIYLAKLSQRAENQFVGVNCGIMDQFSIGMGAANKVIFLNCGTLEFKLVPLMVEGHKLVISNTNKRRGLADSKYNERRAQCEAAVEQLSTVKKIPNLSALSLKEFEEIKDVITDPVIRKRARHVISENNRVLQAMDALNSGNLSRFGVLMNESHDSLKSDYEVTGIELDTLVEEARNIKGTLGSRMTGAGFGGCTISLVREESVKEFIEKVGVNYQKRIGLKPDFYVAVVGDGTRRLE